ncbi:LytR/AlgR family response regulator transcription factor [Foetidibacter luteolus]|uniref:LytR/AlgR family response regulator transcription factor n=1 Tax=Foetidibacter luteolus TaxID=2608880 RepID=UPI00129A3AF3|nr:LytTR family DNA-binding domain-containing protein [Foetidibacter luteolus]
MKILIIEDEAKAARELQSIITKIDDTLNVVAILESVEQAVEWFANNQHPDLIFSDIQLADGLSFDIYSKTGVQCPVVFCTAFDEYLMTAFDTNAVSYLLKPATQEKVEKALLKFKSLKSVFEKETEQQHVANLLGQLNFKYKSALLVHLKDKIIPLQVKDVAFIYLANGLVSITTQANQKYYISSTMDDLEKTLDPVLFYRANRQFIIHRNAIANAERFFARKLVAKLHVATPEHVVISKAKASEFLAWLEGG